MKKKILISSVHMGLGGIESVLINFLEKIDYKKYEVDLILYKKIGHNLKNIPKQVNVYSPFLYKQKVSFLDKLTNEDKTYNKIIRKLAFNKLTMNLYLKKKKYDVGIAFSGYHELMDTFIKNSNCDKKYIWIHTDMKYLVEHDEKYHDKFFKTKNKYNGFDKIIAVSKSVLESFSLILPEYKNKVEYIWNILPTKVLPGNIKLSDKYNIVSVGRLEMQKGYDRLIEITEKLLEHNKDFHIYVLGNGKKKEELLNLVEEKNLSKYISFLGAKENVYEYLNSADLFLSTSYYEGLCTAIIEALLCKLPVVAPNVTGIVDIAEEMAPKNSFILTDDNNESIKKGVIDAMKGKINKDFDFDSNKINVKIVKKYNDLLEGKI